MVVVFFARLWLVKFTNNIIFRENCSFYSLVKINSAGHFRDSVPLWLDKWKCHSTRPPFVAPVVSLEHGATTKPGLRCLLLGVSSVLEQILWRLLMTLFLLHVVVLMYLGLFRVISVVPARPLSSLIRVVSVQDAGPFSGAFTRITWVHVHRARVLL